MGFDDSWWKTFSGLRISWEMNRPGVRLQGWVSTTTTTKSCTIPNLKHGMNQLPCVPKLGESTVPPEKRTTLLQSSLTKDVRRNWASGALRFPPNRLLGAADGSNAVGLCRNCRQQLFGPCGDLNYFNRYSFDMFQLRLGRSIEVSR